MRSILPLLLSLRLIFFVKDTSSEVTTLIYPSYREFLEVGKLLSQGIAKAGAFGLQEWKNLRLYAGSKADI